jgi:putative ABC transport system substrate-binding protein
VKNQKLVHGKTISIILLVVFGVVSLADAQAKKVPRIGFLSSSSLSSAEAPEVFLKAIRGLGYVENQNVAIEYRYAEEVTERLPNLAAELVNLKVDVIVAIGTPQPVQPRMLPKQSLSSLTVLPTL